MIPNFNQGINQNRQPQIFTMLVSGEDLPNTYPVGLNCIGLFIDFNACKFWVRENLTGVPKPLRVFSFNEIIQQPTYQNTDESIVSREEFNNLSQNVGNLSEQINKLIAELGGK